MTTAFASRWDTEADYIGYEEDDYVPPLKRDGRRKSTEQMTQTIGHIPESTPEVRRSAALCVVGHLDAAGRPASEIETALAMLGLLSDAEEDLA